MAGGIFDNLRNLASLAGKAREFKARLEQMQDELGRKTVEGDAGAGAVRVTMSGRMEVLAVRLDRPLIEALAGQGSQADQQMVEDLIAAAFNAALAKAQELSRQEMAKLTGGLTLPGLDQLVGGAG